MPIPPQRRRRRSYFLFFTLCATRRVLFLLLAGSSLSVDVVMIVFDAAVVFRIFFSIYFLFVVCRVSQVNSLACKMECANSRPRYCHFSALFFVSGQVFYFFFSFLFSNPARKALCRLCIHATLSSASLHKFISLTCKQCYHRFTCAFFAFPFFFFTSLQQIFLMLRRHKNTRKKNPFFHVHSITSISALNMASMRP